ncbi:MAG: DnaJ domain-containing protein [Nanoarchaeota archaeon]|nr:DnaJ domain-containing protein [Nanoarchaeota archaeon]
MKKSRNLYDILGIDKTTSQSDIKKAYQRVAFQNHPDRNSGSPESHRKFVEIGEAYELLSNPEKRKQYDTFGTTEREGFPHSEDFAQTVNKYKERFYEENGDIFLSQIDDSTRILYAGFDPQVDIGTARTHVSKSRRLPILKGEKQGCNVKVTSIGYNFHSYFLGVELQEPVAATLMYPISGLFGRYALSGHTDLEGAPAITNFEKLYHNRTLVQKFGVECGNALQAALAIRYLNEISKLPAQKIFDIVLDKTNYGKIDAIDFNAVGDGAAKLANILNLGFEKFTYYDFDVTNAPELFKRINVDWFDTELGKSSVHFEFVDQPLPAMPIPSGALYIPTNTDMQAVGLSKQVPAKNLKYKDDHQKERYTISRQGIVSDNYHRAEWGNMKWTVNTPNGLDTAMTAFMLTHILAPTLSYFVPDRLMLPGGRQKVRGKDNLEKLVKNS